jgi:hypothetical protein
MQRKAPVHRSDQLPSRTVVQGWRGRRHQGPASRPRSAIRPIPPRAAHLARSRRRQGRGQGAIAADLSAPLIPLTLRAMHPTPHPHGRSLERPAFALFSVLALLAFACFPVLAQAETVYESEQTTLPGETVKNPSGHKNHHQSEGSPQADASGAPEGGGSRSKSQNGASKGSNPSTPGGGGQDQSKQGDDASKSQGQPVGNVQAAQPVSSTAADDGSSSPLVPILIAVAVLAAISIGAVLVRQRRDSDGSFSPKAS